MDCTKYKIDYSVSGIETIEIILNTKLNDNNPKISSMNGRSRYPFSSFIQKIFI